MTGEPLIQKAAVIGAGAMGSGIAAQLANAGVTVYLLDILPADSNEPDRNLIANKAIQRMLKAAPATDPLNAGFMSPDSAKRIIPGNITDHLAEAVQDADWVVEAVVENLAVKKNLYNQLQSLCKPTAVMSSNTSTIPLKTLIDDLSPDFQKKFIITHFFNPPRFMHLLEIVGTPQTETGLLERMQAFGEESLGKHVIICKDTPAFLANRIGIFFMFRAIIETIERDLPIEMADAILGTPIGYPKEGIFGLLDLVGIGIIPLVTESLLSILPADDRFRAFDHEKGLALVHALLADGCTGRNAPNGGFYRMQKLPDGTKQKQAVTLSNGRYQSGQYHTVEKPRLTCISAARKLGPRALYEVDDQYARFAWAVVRDTLLYAATLIPEIADDIADVDAALRGGYNAHWGPFQQMDQLGVAWFCARVKEDGISLPPVLEIAAGRSFYRILNGRTQRLVFDFEEQQARYEDFHDRPGCLSLETVKATQAPLITHYSASLWDMGDGVTCLEFHSKMNTLDPSTLWVIQRSIEWMNANAGAYKAMVIYNEGKNFSLGANLGLVAAGFQFLKLPWVNNLGLANVFAPLWYGQIEKLVFLGQSVMQALRYAPFPVVGAPNGMALGGGCEILLHCDALQASAETYMGLVESGVGLVPAWGGCTQYLARCMQDPLLKHGPFPAVRQAFQTLLLPQTAVSTSAADARQKLWLQTQDGISMNADRLLADAKAKALQLAQHYQAPAKHRYQLPGASGHAALNMAVDDFYLKGEATSHDVLVADALAEVLTGGDTEVSGTLTESDLLQLEREAFLSLIHTPQTQKRIAHTLKTGKPLREDIQADKESVAALRQKRRVKPLRKREISGAPLEGNARQQLKQMAEVTAFLLKKLAP